MTEMFEGLAAEFGEPVTRAARGSVLDGTPVRDWVAESRKSGQAVKVGPVTEENANKLVQLIRRASAEAGHGVAFAKLEPVKGQRGKVTLRFQAKDKKEMDMSAEAVALRGDRRRAVKAVREANPKTEGESDSAYATRIKGILASTAQTANQA